MGTLKLHTWIDRVPMAYVNIFKKIERLVYFVKGVLSIAVIILVVLVQMSSGRFILIIIMAAHVYARGSAVYIASQWLDLRRLLDVETEDTG